MSDHPYQNFIKGKPIDYNLVVQFINSLIVKLNEKLAEKELKKLEVIGVLGPNAFLETKNKKYSPTQSVYEYMIAGIDNDSDPIIEECLKDIGLENGLFDKHANKRIFAVKNGKFGRYSSNNGHWISEANMMSDESIMEFVQNKGIQFDDIILKKEDSKNL